MSVELWPNLFTLWVYGQRNVPVQMRVPDVNDKSLQQMKGAAEQAFRFGSSLSTGLYLIEVRQEDDLKTVK